jgi:hypothetical protein
MLHSNSFQQSWFDYRVVIAEWYEDEVFLLTLGSKGRVGIFKVEEDIVLHAENIMI